MRGTKQRIVLEQQSKRAALRYLCRHRGSWAAQTRARQDHRLAGRVPGGTRRVRFRWSVTRLASSTVQTSARSAARASGRASRVTGPVQHHHAHQDICAPRTHTQQPLGSRAPRVPWPKVPGIAPSGGLCSKPQSRLRDPIGTTHDPCLRRSDAIEVGDAARPTPRRRMNCTGGLFSRASGRVDPTRRRHSSAGERPVRQD